ncbi:hypothetical protein [Kribbella sp. HUAS MG21]|uniref:PPE family protein n=1 Tax=Kribbella sp. HUAS MG21 TaxID=3160966 RepID=A0AAU7TI49_9ACTN
MPTDYAAGAMVAQTVNALQAVMNDIDQKAQADKALQGPLNTAAQMWQASYETITTAAQAFPRASEKLVGNWQSPAPVAIYKDAAAASTNSLVSASAAILGSNGPGSNQGGASIPAMLTGLANYIGVVAGATAQAKAALDKAIEQFNSDLGAQALEKLFVDLNRPIVVAAGGQLSALAAEYERLGPQLLGTAQQLQWKGPGAGNTVPPGGPSTRPGSSPDGPSAQTDGGDQPGGGPGGAPGEEQPGGAPGGGPGGAPGGTPGGGAPGDVPGGMPGGVPVGSVPGGLPNGQGTGLAGLPTAVRPPSIEQFTPPNIPAASVTTPSGGLPVGGVPVPGGLGRGIGGGGLGGGLGGAGGGGVGKADLPKAGGVGGVTGDKPIARAGEQLSPQPAPSGGRAPGSPAGTGLAGTPAAGAGAGGGVPPMMPPGAGMGAGGSGGRAGKSGAAGTIRPVGRKRDRQNDETPGVPVGLRGKAGKDLPGAFPVAPVTARRRPEKAPAETLQLLDEDLWKVEDEPAAARRYAN